MFSGESNLFISLVDVPHVLCDVVCGAHLIYVFLSVRDNKSPLLIPYRECEVRVTKGYRQPLPLEVRFNMSRVNLL
jgi:hypothetical protein